MTSAQDRPPDLPQGGQVGQSTSGPGTTAGGPGTTGDTMTTTGTGRHANPSATSGYARGTEAGYPPEGAAYEAGTSGGVVGGTFLVIAGLLTFFAGLAAVVRASYFHAVSAIYPYAWSIRGWGWAILILGAVMFAVGACAILGMAWAKPVGVFLAVLAIIGSFMWLVYSPFWGIIMLALSALAIWGLLRRDLRISGHPQHEPRAGEVPAGARSAPASGQVSRECDRRLNSLRSDRAVRQ